MRICVWEFCRYTFQSICWIHVVYWSIHLRHTRRISCNKSVRNHWRNDCITSIHLAGYLAKRNWSKLGVALCGRLGGDLGCQIGSECVFFLFIYLLIFLDGGTQGDTSHVFLSLRISFGIHTHTHTHRNLETYRHSIAGKQFFFLGQLSMTGGWVVMVKWRRLYRLRTCMFKFSIKTFL